MGIKVQHGDPRDIIKLGKLAGEARAAEIKAQREAAKEAAVMEMKNRRELAMFQSQLQLERAKFQHMAGFEAEKRAKLWEIEKMQMRSQFDFMRKEEQRARKLKDIDNSLAAIDKEVEAGRISKKEAYPIKLKLEVSKSGVDLPSTLLKDSSTERYGVQPYWMRGKDAPPGTPERKLYEAQIAQKTMGERGGTVPWYLTPKYVDTPAGVSAQMENNIFLEDAERQRMAVGMTTKPQEKQPTPAELRKQGTRQAYEIGVQLGYWK